MCECRVFPSINILPLFLEMKFHKCQFDFQTTSTSCTWLNWSRHSSKKNSSSDNLWVKIILIYPLQSSVFACIEWYLGSNLFEKQNLNQWLNLEIFENCYNVNVNQVTNTRSFDFRVTFFLVFVSFFFNYSSDVGKHVAHVALKGYVMIYISIRIIKLFLIFLDVPGWEP